MIGQEYDIELLRFLRFPSASPEDMGEENGSDREVDGEVEWETLRHGIFLEDESGTIQKTRGHNMSSLTICKVFDSSDCKPYLDSIECTISTLEFSKVGLTSLSRVY